MSVNKVMLIGRMGNDPEKKTTDNGSDLITFSLATSEKYTDKSGERVESTEWHNIVFWGGAVNAIEKYTEKGCQVYVEGKLRHKEFEKDGVIHRKTEVIGSNITFLGKKDNTPF